MAAPHTSYYRQSDPRSWQDTKTVRLLARRLGTFWRIWLPGVALMTAWNVAWILAWLNFVFDALARSSSAGVAVFANTDGRALGVWITAVIGFVIGATGLALLASSSQVFPDRKPLLASRLWRIGGIALTLVGLSLLILFPSTVSVIIDEPGARVAVETRWLYWKTTEALAVNEVDRVSFRDYRLSVGPRPEDCKVQTGLSIVDHNRNAIAVPSGLDHETVANGIADTLGVRLEVIGVREC